MSSNKTVPTDASVSTYLTNISNEARRNDCEALVELMRNATGQLPVKWGTSIVGFGRCHYRYNSGREGDMCLVGFAARKNEIAIFGLIPKEMLIYLPHGNKLSCKSMTYVCLDGEKKRLNQRFPNKNFLF